MSLLERTWTYEPPTYSKQPSIEVTLEELRGLSRPVQSGVHSYLDDGRPLAAAFATGLESGSFKERNGIVETAAQVAQGVREAVLFSAGNHLTGTALGARATELFLYGFVPAYTPQGKVDLSKHIGATYVQVKRVSGGLELAQ